MKRPNELLLRGRPPRFEHLLEVIHSFLYRFYMAHSCEKLGGLAPFDPKLASKVAIIVLNDVHAAEVRQQEATRDKATHTLNESKK